MSADAHEIMGARQALRWMFSLLAPERPFVTVALVYGVGVSILSLATPISVQMLINSVANTALVAPLVTLAGALLGLLLIAVLLSSLRIYIMEIFARRFYARLVAEITLRAVYARNPFFQDANREDLFNRYFDVVTVQKAVPSLLIGGFTIILQSAVGFAVTSFYHPFFLAFNALVIVLALAILFFPLRGAIRSGIALSHAKYNAIDWLESLAGSNGFFKSARHVDHAMDRSEDFTATYITAKKRHFRYSFAQTVCFLLLYAFASAGLLALGGWLVIQGQLSIGQLVAAELILSAAFFGLGQLGAYLDMTYDLIAGAEELGLLFAIEQEDDLKGTKGNAPISNGSAVEFRNVVYAPLTLRGKKAHFSLKIPSGSRLLAAADSHEVQRCLTHGLKRHIRPESGLVTLGGHDIKALDAFKLRSNVIVLDRPAVPDVTITEYLGLAGRSIGSDAMLDALATVGLARRVEELSDGLDTRLSSTGWPLSFGEVMQLKLAGALIKKPQVLVLTGLYDMVDSECLHRALDAFDDATTLIVFSNRTNEWQGYTHLWLGREEQSLLTDAGEWDRLRRQSRGEKELNNAV